MSDRLKLCSKCQKLKPLTEFHRRSNRPSGHASACKDCLNPLTKLWRVGHPGYATKKSSEYYTANLISCRKNSLAYGFSHRAQRNTREQKRRRDDPVHRAVSNLRGRLNKVMAGKQKSEHFFTLVGATPELVRAHLEKLFRLGMTWSNYGPVWHIDHKKPCASFVMTDPEQQKECFHFSNLQPLFAKENLSKGAKING